jgi:hypothetical protein
MFYLLISAKIRFIAKAKINVISNSYPNKGAISVACDTGQDIKRFSFPPFLMGLP